jgi:two-component system chemotaxis response regulator CheY
MASGWILVVDDEESAREVICETLDDLGCKAVGARNGTGARTALEAAAAPPCVIVLDLMMPGMNGWDFREWQRNDPRYAAVPVVVVSAVRDLEAEAQRLAVDWLPKPVGFGPLLAKVERYCGPCG